MPEHAFDGPAPRSDDWHIVVVPPDATGPEALGLYRDGETIPFSDVDAFRDRFVTTDTAQDLAEESEDSSSTPTDDAVDDSESGQDDTDDETRFRRF